MGFEVIKRFKTDLHEPFSWMYSLRETNVEAEAGQLKLQGVAKSQKLTRFARKGSCAKLQTALEFG